MAGIKTIYAIMEGDSAVMGTIYSILGPPNWALNYLGCRLSNMADIDIIEL